MYPPEVSPDVTIRPAWPDELPALARLFRPPLAARACNRWLVAVRTDDRERLLGAAAWIALSGGAPADLVPADAPVLGAHGPADLLFWDSLPAHGAGPLPDRLLQGLLADARRRGRARVASWAMLRPGSVDHDRLRRLGFEPQEGTTAFSAPFARVLERAGRIYDRVLARGAIPPGARISGFTPELLPLIRACFHNQGVVNYEDFDAWICPEHPEHMDLARSTVVLVDGRLLGAMMVCRSGRDVLVPGRWVAEGWRNTWVNAVLIRNSAHLLAPLGLERARFLAHGERHRETERLAARLGGEAVSRCERLRLDLLAAGDADAGAGRPWAGVATAVQGAEPPAPAPASADEAAAWSGIDGPHSARRPRWPAPPMDLELLLARAEAAADPDARRGDAECTGTRPGSCSGWTQDPLLGWLHLPDDISVQAAGKGRQAVQSQGSPAGLPAGLWRLIDRAPSPARECAEAGCLPATPAESAREPLLVVTLGTLGPEQLRARLDAGHLPRLRRLLAGGFLLPLRGSGPAVPALRWKSLFTGRGAGTWGAGVRPDGESALAIWEQAVAAGLSAVVVGESADQGSLDATPGSISGPTPGQSYRTSGQGRLALISEHFGAPHCVPSGATLDSTIQPPALRALLADCWLRPDDLDPAVLDWMVPGWPALDQTLDPALAGLADALVLTLSRQLAAMRLLHRQGADLSIVDLPLLAVATAPDCASLPGRDAQVIPACCRLLDALLARLLDATGPAPNLLLVSQTGPMSRSVESPGLLAGTGPALRACRRIRPASVLDLAPTLRRLLGLSRDPALPGNVLAGLLRPSRAEPWDLGHVRRTVGVASAKDGPVGRSPSPLRAWLGALVDLDDPLPAGEDASALAPTRWGRFQGVGDTWRWNLARALLADGAADAALALLEPIAAREPDNLPVQVAQWHGLLQLGLIGPARSAVRGLREHLPGHPLADALAAWTDLADGEPVAALRGLAHPPQAADSGPLRNLARGATLLAQRRWSAALCCYEQVLAHHPAQPDALLGRAAALLHLQQGRPVLDAVLAARDRLPDSACAQVLLALALLRNRRWAGAGAALMRAVRLAPDWPRPRQLLLCMQRRRGAPDALLRAHRSRLAEIWRRQRVELLGAQQRWAERQRQQAAARDAARQTQAREQRAREALLELSRDLPPWLTGRGRSSRIGRAEDASAVSGAPAQHTGALALTLVSGLSVAVPDAARLLDLLEDAGLPALRDGPGICHWSPMDALRTNPGLLYAADGKLVWVPAHRLGALPRLHHYLVLFLDCHQAEALVGARDSGPVQRDGDTLPPRDLVLLLRRHRNAALSLLHARPNVDVLLIDPEQLHAEPARVLAEARAFLQPGLLTAS